ncbi:hypothetical protein CUMW_117440 [Citrus unshiu]|nr:hypothetical protein CUMW_117440 [Citrus unshiu]
MEFWLFFQKFYGHKAIKIVKSVRENEDEIGEGDIVIPHFVADSTERVDCRSKKSNLCSSFPFEISSWRMPRDRTNRFKDLRYPAVDVAHLLKVDSTAWKTAYVEAGSTAIIVGLILYEVAKVARLCGGTRITGVDVNQEKFEIGE